MLFVIMANISVIIWKKTSIYLSTGANRSFYKLVVSSFTYIIIQCQCRWLSLSSMCMYSWYNFNRQLLFFTANIVVLGQGCAIGWISPTLPILQSDNSPLESGKLTIEEASWVGSISSIGSVVGTIYFGLISVYLGSKNTLILCAFPVTVSFL